MRKYHPKQKLILMDPITGETISGRVIATLSFCEKIWVEWDNGITDAYSIKWLNNHTMTIS
jgi:hypothetical protein